MDENEGRAAAGDGAAGAKTPTPADGTPLEGIETLLRFDEMLWSVTQGMPLKIGSILRLNEDAYEAWGLKPPSAYPSEERQRLAALSEARFNKDMEEDLERDGTPSKENLLITSVTLKAEIEMAKAMGDLIAEMLMTKGNIERPVRIAYLGAKSQLMVNTIISRLFALSQQDGILQPDIFRHVEVTGTSLDGKRGARTRVTLNEAGIENAVYVIPTMQFLKLDWNRERFDFIVSLSHFSRFGFSEYIGALHDALVPGGAVVAGDIHSSLYESPYNIRRIFEALSVTGQMDRMRIDGFDGLFGPALLTRENPRQLAIEERNALDTHISEWVEVAKKLNATPNLGKQRVFLLGANERSADRIRKFREAGFLVDKDDIARAFPTERLDDPARGRVRRLMDLPMRVNSNSDFGVVMAAVKRR